MSYKEPQPIKSVPIKEEDKENILRPGDSLGSFVGYLRRPKSTSAGLVAQFFGENGTDADVISALHLTKFLDSYVKITVWMIKDRNGRLMKKDGKYKKLTEFIAKTRRPQPSISGQVAQFFGENGKNADAINILNQSDYLDALVFIEMHQALQGMTTMDLNTDIPTDELNRQSSRMTPTELKDMQKLQKRSSEALKVLFLHGFFRQQSVLSKLGRESNYTTWLSTQWCCHPSDKPCDGQEVTAWKIPGVTKMGYIPLCLKHKEEWENKKVSLPDGSNALSFAKTQSIIYLQRWAQQALKKELKVKDDYIPTPGLVFTWIVDNNLQMFVPNEFKNYLR